ncbi:methyltransferase domain-containing protein [Salana multivorans]
MSRVEDRAVAEAGVEAVLTVLPGALPALRRELVRVGLTSSPCGGDVEPEDDDGERSDLGSGSTDNELRLVLPRTPETLRALARLRTAVAASLVVVADTPRPTGLLSSEALADLDRVLETISWQRPRVRFTGLRLEAAGSDSPQMRRIAAELADRAGVGVDDEGDLVVRVRRSPGGGWEALVRTTPRPLATRPWRTERYPGALNATIAAAVVDELDSHCEVAPEGRPVVVDLMCGSGTLTLERLARGPVARMVAVDIAPEAVAVLERHQRASRIKGRIEPVVADVADVARGGGALDDVRGTADVVMANPPWGELLGEHETNERLYRELLDAADRLGAPGVVVGILTHDIRRFERVLAGDTRWRLVARPQFFAKGHRPRLFVLRRA